jgi:hypothetical protein
MVDEEDGFLAKEQKEYADANQNNMDIDAARINTGLAAGGAGALGLGYAALPDREKSMMEKLRGIIS